MSDFSTKYFILATLNRGTGILYCDLWSFDLPLFILTLDVTYKFENETYEIQTFILYFIPLEVEFIKMLS